MADQAVAKIVTEAGEEMEISAAELPDDASQIIDILKTEKVHGATWRQIATMYYRTGRFQQFEDILKEASTYEKDKLISKEDRLLALNMLVSFYTTKATQESVKEKKDELFDQATRFFNRAENIDIKFEMTLVNKGVMFLAKGDQNRAKSQFEIALTINPKNLPATLGMACLLYHKGSYDLAFERFCQVLRASPNCSSRIRLGLGLCLYQLALYERARAAFERTLELEPDCVEAMIGIALVHINNGELSYQERAKLSMEMLGRAYRVNSNNAMVLNHLSRYFFFKDDHQKVQKLALSAQRNTENKMIRSEALQNLARAYHAQHDYKNALVHYQRSSRMWDSFPLPLFGLGQMYIHEKDFPSSIACFEKVAEVLPDNLETMKVLGVLYATQGRPEKAEAQLTAVTEMYPGDADGWMELAQFLESSDWQRSSKAYERALAITQNHGTGEVPFELWNNVGVLRQRTGNLEGAMQAYREAQRVRGQQECLSVSFNMARLMEDMHKGAEAQVMYKEILKVHPTYVDCYLRLAQIARASGRVDEASNWLKEAIGVQQDNPDAWSLWGNTHMDKNEWVPAQKKFERVVGHIDKEDSYALLSLAHLRYLTSRPNDAKERQNWDIALKTARTVLQRDKQNADAANILAAVMAEMGFVDCAKEIFTELAAQVGDSMPNAFINLGHIALNDKEYDKAVSIYSNASRRFFLNQNTKVLTYIFYALFEGGKVEESLKMMGKAVHMEPHNTTLRHNYAVALYHACVTATKTKHLTIGPIKKAVSNMRCATSTFQYLSTLGKSSSVRFTKEQIDVYLTKCKTVSDKLAKMHANVSEKERVAERLRLEKLEKLKRMQEEDMQKKLAEEKEKEMQKRREEERLAQQKQRLQALQSQWEFEKTEVKEEAKSKKGKKRVKVEEDEFLSGSNRDEDRPATKKQKRLQRQLLGSDSESEGSAPAVDERSESDADTENRTTTDNNNNAAASQRKATDDDDAMVADEPGSPVASIDDGDEIDNDTQLPDIAFRQEGEDVMVDEVEGEIDDKDVDRFFEGDFP